MSRRNSSPHHMHLPHNNAKTEITEKRNREIYKYVGNISTSLY